MIDLRRFGAARTVAAVISLAWLGTAAVPAQQPDESAVIQGIDAATKTRFESIAGFTVTEHYTVYRGSDETHPAAEMTVKTTYRRETGKSYEILSESGPELIRRFGLHPLLENEKSINLPGNVEHSWFTSANYGMKLKPGGIQQLDGRDCFALVVTPKRKAPNMIAGTLWVDAKDFSIVQIEGTASKSPSIWTAPPHMMRNYTNVSGFAMSNHARAVSSSFLVGRTIVTIDYRDYQIQLVPGK
ncbi:MAG: hypothetical protein ABSC47_08800 [Terracidiphilus sp.]|jgi:outer membrane lipoprotein-sorting protein